MKICITAKGAGMNASFEPRFARAPYFILYDTGQGDYEAIRNGLILSEGKVGRSAVQVLAMNMADAVITGAIGGNARDELRSAAIRLILHEGNGSAGEILREVLAQLGLDDKNPNIER